MPLPVSMMSVGAGMESKGEFSYGQCELLSDTDARTPIERQILPSWPAAIPSLRLELISIGAPEIFSAVNDGDLL